MAAKILNFTTSVFALMQRRAGHRLLPLRLSKRLRRSSFHSLSTCKMFSSFAYLFSHFCFAGHSPFTPDIVLCSVVAVLGLCCRCPRTFPSFTPVRAVFSTGSANLVPTTSASKSSSNNIRNMCTNRYCHKYYRTTFRFVFISLYLFEQHSTACFIEQGEQTKWTKLSRSYIYSTTGKGVMVLSWYWLSILVSAKE